MSSLIPMVIGQELGNAGYRDRGQSTGLLGGPGAIDGTAQSFYNLADPVNLTGKASSGHVLANIADPGNALGLNQAANPYGPGGMGSGTPSALPTLPGVGAPTTYDPKTFGGYANLGPGVYNHMASRMAGRAFRPMPMHPSFAKAREPMPTGGKGLSRTVPELLEHRDGKARKVIK